MVHHDGKILLLSEVDEPVGLLRVRCERLFDEDMLSIFECGFCQLEMGPDGCDNSYGVDVLRRDELSGIRCCPDLRISLLYRTEGFLIFVTDRNHTGIVDALKISHNVRSPVAITMTPTL